MSAPHNARARLLEAARDVFSRFGAAGATTRRIAEEAGVNEVTVFRHFGSKEALLDEAARAHVTGEHPVPLPEKAKHAQEELTAWCAREIDRLRSSRAFILQCLSEEISNPSLGECGALPLSQAAEELSRYVGQLSRDGRVRHPEDTATAMTMLVGAMYADALGRPTLPEAITVAPDRAPALYVRLFLRSLGVK